MKEGHCSYDPGAHFRGAKLEGKYEQHITFAKKGFLENIILLKCVECQGLDYREALNCLDYECPLYTLNEKYIKNNPDLKPKRVKETNSPYPDDSDYNSIYEPNPKKGRKKTTEGPHNQF